MRLRAAAPALKKRERGPFKRKQVKVAGKRRFVRSDASPYTVKPALQNAVIDQIEHLIRKHPLAQRTDKYTLLEIVNRLLQKYIRLPRPEKVRSHLIFAMFVKPSSRVRPGLRAPCHEWQGAFERGLPVLTTTNSIAGTRLKVDARKYIIENPAQGKRRNFRTIPHNMCNNPACVNPRHIVMLRKNPDSHVGENHPRAKYTDKDIKKLVREYNAGATAKVLAKKWGMSLTYVEQVMRKERREEATQGMTIRGRFGEY